MAAWNDAALVVVDCWARGIIAPPAASAPIAPAVEIPSRPRSFFAGEIEGIQWAIGQLSGRTIRPDRRFSPWYAVVVTWITE